MVPDVLGLVVPLLVLTGSFVLIGLKGWSNHKLKMREPPDGDNERLAEAVQRLHDEVAELQERADFTERVLSEVRSRNAIGPGDQA